MRAVGIIEAVKVRDKGFSIMVNGQWFGSQAQLIHQKGDSVEIEFETSPDGKWNNITSLKANTVKGGYSKPMDEDKVKDNSVRASGLVDNVTSIAVEVIKTNGNADIAVLIDNATAKLIESYNKIRANIK